MNLLQSLKGPFSLVMISTPCIFQSCLMNRMSPTHWAFQSMLKWALSDGWGKGYGISRRSSHTPHAGHMSCQIASHLSLREGAAGGWKATLQTDIISLTTWPGQSWGLQLCSVSYLDTLSQLSYAAIKHKADLSKLGSPKSRHKSGSITVQSIKCIICGYYQILVNIYLNVIINCMVVWWLALFQCHSNKVLSGNQGLSL